MNCHSMREILLKSLKKVSIGIMVKSFMKMSIGVMVKSFKRVRVEIMVKSLKKVSVGIIVKLHPIVGPICDILELPFDYFFFHNIVKSLIDQVSVVTKVKEVYNYIYIYILSVYSPFSNRVGLPLHKSLSQFLPVIDIFYVDLKFSHVRFCTLTMSFLVFQLAFCLQLVNSIHFFTHSSSLFLIHF